MTSILFLIIGIGFSLVGYHLLFWNRRLEKNGIKTRAEIIDYSKENVEFSEGKKTIYFPILKFTDRNGKVVIQKHDSGEHIKLKSGFVEIYYLKKQNEYEVLINNDGWKTYFPIGTIVFGMVFLIIGVFLFIKNH